MIPLFSVVINGIFNLIASLTGSITYFLSGFFYTRLSFVPCIFYGITGAVEEPAGFGYHFTIFQPHLVAITGYTAIAIHHNTIIKAHIVIRLYPCTIPVYHYIITTAGYITFAGCVCTVG